jgi:hypothetical protein
MPKTYAPASETGKRDRQARATTKNLVGKTFVFELAFFRCMGFATEETGGAPPEWPHIVCAGAADGSGSGWAWHEDMIRRRCFAAITVAAPASTVAAAIDGRELSGIDRVLAVVRLKEESCGSIRRVFGFPCAACDGNHRERVQQILRSAPYIHPDAIPVLRAAMVPERFLRVVLIHKHNEEPLPRDAKELEKALADPRKQKDVKRRLALSKNLPVWPDDLALTRLAQIRFAQAYASRHGIRLDIPATAVSQERARLAQRETT